MNSGTCDFIIAQENEFVNGKMKLIVLFTNCFFKFYKKLCVKLCFNKTQLNAENLFN